MEGHLGSDAQFLNRLDVAPGPVLGIRDEPRWSELATKEGAAQLVGAVAQDHEEGGGALGGGLVEDPASADGKDASR